MWMCEECFRSNPDRNNVCFCGRIRGVDFEECESIKKENDNNNEPIKNNETEEERTDTVNDNDTDTDISWMIWVGVFLPICGWMLIAALVVRGENEVAHKLYNKIVDIYIIIGMIIFFGIYILTENMYFFLASAMLFFIICFICVKRLIQ